MDISLLRKAGLVDSQAKAYLSLLENGTLTVTQLTSKINESRANTYAALNKLTGYGLVTKNETPKVATYTASHPSNLESLVEKRRKVILRNEQDVKQGLPVLIDLFYAQQELPGIRVLSGQDGIHEVYQETLRDKQDIYLIRTIADTAILGKEFIDAYRHERARLGITTYALTPPTPTGIKNHRNGTDERLNIKRIFLPAGAYEAPVEIDVFGDKVALIAFGNTQVANIIISPPIAEAFRQIIILLRMNLSERER